MTPIELKEMLLKAGQDLVPDFTIDDNNRETYNQLYYYLAQHIRFEETKEGKPTGNALGRGLFLMGQVGTGKTDMMRVLQRCFNRLQDRRRFAYVNMIELARQYSITGPEVFDKYQRKNLYVDEFGLIDANQARKFEQIMYYGNRVDVGEQLALTRYEEFKQRGNLTHFSTNLTPVQLETLYDSRTYSRLFEMCNFIPVTGSDRRKTAKPKPPVIQEPETAHKAHELIPLLLQNYPKEAAGIIQAVERMAGQGKPKPPGLEVKAETHEGFMAKFIARLPDTETAELKELHREAQTALNPDVARAIEAELTKRNEAFTPYRGRTGKAA